MLLESDNLFVDEAILTGESYPAEKLPGIVVRSSKAFFISKPGKYLVAATLTIVATTLALPYTPIASLVGFVPLSLSLLGLLGVIVLLYLSTAEIAKHIFYRLVKS